MPVKVERFCYYLQSRYYDNKNITKRLPLIEEAEKDLLFYLRKYHELTSRSKFMKAVVDKEIKRLEKELKELGKYY